MASHAVLKRNFSRRFNSKKALLRGLVKSLILNGRIRTTHAKALETKKFIDGVVLRLRSPTVASRRVVRRKYGWSRKEILEIEGRIKGKYSDRQSGFSRITKLGVRPGDFASMSVIELV